MKLGIVGSKTFNDYDRLVRFISENVNIIPENTEVYIRDYDGASKLGRRWAMMNRIKTNVVRKGKPWGPDAKYTNHVNIAKLCDEVVVFWDGESQGTQFDIEYMDEFEIPYSLCRFDIPEIIPEGIENED